MVQSKYFWVRMHSNLRIIAISDEKLPNKINDNTIEEVFEEFEISASGNAQIEQVTLDEEYLVSMVESYKRSKLSKIMDQTISEFSSNCSSGTNLAIFLLTSS